MIRFILAFATLLLAGCGNSAPQTEQKSSEPATAQSSENTGKTTASAETPQTGSPAPKPTTFKPLSLGALGGGEDSTNNTAKSGGGKDTLNSVLDAMQPLQVFLGQWNTTTSSKGAGSASWVWDFQTDKSQPALVMSSKGNPYFDTVRLTFLTDEQKFQLTAKDKDEQNRIYQGEFTEKPHFVTGDGGKPEQRFEMMLSEVGNEDARKLVGVRLTQRDRNRMWMEVFQRSGKSVLVQDNVASQRDGTSFAVSDTDYGDKECIVSQGLGTMTVSFMGRTYYVCCSGCQAAFNDDPTFWIDKAEERKQTEKK